MPSRVTKIPALDVPQISDPSVRDTLNRVTEALDVRLGRKGDPLDRAITLRELIDSGLATSLKSRPFNPNNPSLDFAPPLPVYAKPPKPTGVSASAAFRTITIFWDTPLYAGHSFAEIWRHDSNSIGDATLLGISPTTAYTDVVGSATTYYYWVRFVNASNITGDFHSNNGVSGTTAPDVNYLLTTLAGQVTTSQLATSLAETISLITAPSSTAGSVNARLAAEAATRQAEILALQSQIDVLNLIEEYDNTATYNANDMVISGGLLYRAIATTTGNAPPNVTYWAAVGDYSSFADLASNNAAAITQINFVDVTSTSAIAVAVATQQSEFNDPETGSTQLATILSALRTEVFPAGIASASRIDSLESTVNNPTTGVSALSTAVSTLNTTVFPDGTGSASAITNLQTQLNGLDEDYGVTAAAVNLMLTQVYPDGTGSASAVTQINTRLNNYTSGVTVEQALTTNVDAVGVLNGQYSVKIDVNGRVAGFGLSNTSAVYDGGIHSEFAVRADRFSIVNTSNNTPIAPFIVVTTPTTNNGVSVPVGVYITDAFIRNGAIVNAKIGNLAVDTAKIADLAVNNAKIADLAVSRAKIQNAAIDTAQINDAAITNAKIGNLAVDSAKIADLSVGTIKITGNAVSQTALAESSGQPTASVNLTARSGTVMVWATFYPTGSSFRWYYIKRNGVVIKSIYVSQVTSPILMVADTPGNGSVTYTAECSISCNRIDLQVLEVLK